MYLPFSKNQFETNLEIIIGFEKFDYQLTTSTTIIMEGRRRKENVISS
tara:strand:+ start:412 stop:555 length:144 start_codon:yes stop_codon:yes gene_type:complete